MSARTVADTSVPSFQLMPTSNPPRARKPVFSIGTLAMAVTMTAAVLGASVDTGVLPPMVHAMIAYGAIALNVAAVRIEIVALAESARVVDEVNHLFDS